MNKYKVSIIGAGQVGGIIAFLLVQKGLADVCLFDIIEGLPQGKALDINQTAGVEKFDSKVIGSNKYEDIKDSNIVVITAGIARKPGMSREDLFKTNANIVKNVACNIKTYSPNSIIIVVTNPLDVLAYLIYKITGFNKNKVMGMAGLLDSARFAYFISKELNVSIKDISSMVLGSHGDSMVPIPRDTTVNGIPITELLSPDKISELSQKTRDGGAEIVALLKIGSAYFAPGSCVTAMIESILEDQKRILPCSVLLEGEYGLSDVFIGVPVKLGKDGVEEVIKLKLTNQELEALKKSAGIIKEGLKSIL
ncbi:MAG: malate dehydrogenase [Candidatus Firestonebacteria bacterium]